MPSSRYLYKFESTSGAVTFTFPLYSYEYEPSMQLASSTIQVAGRNFPIDMLSGRLAPIASAKEIARFTHLDDSLTVLDTNVDAFMAAMYNAMDGYLYTIGADGTIRRARARLENMPALTLGMMPHALPAIVAWERFSNWGVANAINVNQLITVAAQTFQVTNPGNAIQTRMVIRLRSNSITGFNNPTLSNVTYGPQFSSNRDAVSANSELKLDTTVPSVEWSDTNGASYVDDLANYNYPGGSQPLLSFALYPGVQTLRLDNNGTPNLQVEILADSAFFR